MRPNFTPLIILLAGASLGLLSAQYNMDRSNADDATTTNGWTEVRVRGESLNATYQAGHFMRRGQIPPPKGTRFYVRSVDDDGNTLRGDCLVNIEGRMPDARWWHVGAASSGQRTSLDAAHVVTEANGQTILAISTAPAPGNWLIPPASGAYELQLVLLGVEETDDKQLALPKVTRLWC